MIASYDECPAVRLSPVFQPCTVWMLLPLFWPERLSSHYYLVIIFVGIFDLSKGIQDIEYNLFKI